MRDNQKLIDCHQGQYAHLRHLLVVPSGKIGHLSTRVVHLGLQGLVALLQTVDQVLLSCPSSEFLGQRAK